MGCLADTLPGYYGLAEGSWKYFAKQWKVDYEWLKGRFKTPEMMQAKGNSLSLWIHNVVDDANAKNNAGNSFKSFNLYWKWYFNNNTNALKQKRL